MQNNINKHAFTKIQPAIAKISYHKQYHAHIIMVLCERLTDLYLKNSTEMTPSSWTVLSSIWVIKLITNRGQGQNWNTILINNTLILLGKHTYKIIP